MRTLTELGELAESAVRSYLTTGEPMVESLAKVAAKHKLTPAEVTSLSNESNKRAIVALHSQVPKGNLAYGFTYPVIKDDAILSLMSKYDGDEIRATPSLPPTDTRAKVLLELGVGSGPLSFDNSPSEDELEDDPSLGSRSTRAMISRVIDTLLHKVKEREARLVMAKERLMSLQCKLVESLSDQVSMGVPIRVVKNAAPELVDDIEQTLRSRGRFKSAHIDALDYELDRDHEVFAQLDAMRQLDAICQNEAFDAESLRTKVAELRRAYKVAQ